MKYYVFIYHPLSSSYGSYKATTTVPTTVRIWGEPWCYCSRMLEENGKLLSYLASLHTSHGAGWKSGECVLEYLEAYWELTAITIAIKVLQVPRSTLIPVLSLRWCTCLAHLLMWDNTLSFSYQAGPTTLLNIFWKSDWKPTNQLKFHSPSRSTSSSSRLTKTNSNLNQSEQSSVWWVIKVGWKIGTHCSYISEYYIFGFYILLCKENLSELVCKWSKLLWDVS